MAKLVTTLDLAREVEKLVELEVLRTHLLTNIPTATLLTRLGTTRADALCGRLAAKLIVQLATRHALACDVSDRHEGMGYSRQAIEKHFCDAIEHEVGAILAPLDIRTVPREPRAAIKPCIEFTDIMEVE